VGARKDGLVRRARRAEGKCVLDRGLRVDRRDRGAVARRTAGVCGRPRGRHYAVDVARSGTSHAGRLAGVTKHNRCMPDGDRLWEHGARARR